MEPIVIYAIVAGAAVLIGILIGVLIGWLSAKSKFGNRVSTLQALLDNEAAQLNTQKTANDELLRQVQSLRHSVEEISEARIKAEAKAGEQVERMQELHQERELAKGKADELNALLSQSRENHATIKSQQDEGYKNNIQVTNERNRLKDQVEQMRVHENELNKRLASLSATNEELIKSADVLASSMENLQREYRLQSTGNTELTAHNHSLQAKYEEAQKAIVQQKEFVADAQKALKEAFDSLSAQALQHNNQSFLDLAKTALEAQATEAKGDLEQKKQAIEGMIKPLGDSLKTMDDKINSLETKREGAYSNISTLLDQMKQTNVNLDKETRNLVTALKSSNTRGRYGEIALRRLVEFAGMMEHCDFEEQVHTEGEAGRYRPDMIIKLPGNRSVVVDSKVPLSAYLALFETEDPDQQKIHHARHVEALKTHLKQLSAKSYWDQFEEAPDFVVLFMQIESSYVAALQTWPSLIEEAMKNRVIIATPTTLVTILRSIGYSWNQLKTMENIEQIRNAAVELYERSATLIEHFISVGKGLAGTINHYNKAIGSFESNFLPQGRKIQSLSQAYIKKQLPEIEPVEVTVRDMQPHYPQKAGITETSGMTEQVSEQPLIAVAGKASRKKGIKEIAPEAIKEAEKNENELF